MENVLSFFDQKKHCSVNLNFFVIKSRKLDITGAIIILIVIRELEGIKKQL